MRFNMRSVFLLSLFYFCISCLKTEPYPKEKINVDGLKQSVEVYRDKWGINHIYAQNQHDLFFSQGYTAAIDRLFQFEIWRRQATGSVAEILGPDEIRRDIGTRLFMYRGDINKELNHYHPQGEEIIEAYVEGVNKYISDILKTPEKLPLPFKMLDIIPEKWTPEVVISRHQGLLGNIEDELEIGRTVALIGEKKVKELMWFHPKDPEIKLDPKIDRSLLFEDLLGLYNSYRNPVEFKPKHLIEKYRNKKAVSFIKRFNDLSS